MPTQSINARMSFGDWGLLLTLAAIWGGSFFLVEIALRGLPALTIVWLRVGLAAIALWFVLLATGYRPPRDPGVWLAFTVMGTLNNVIPFSLIVWGQTHIDGGLAAILNATTPVFTVLVAGLWLQDERFTGRKFVGVLMGFIGVAVMIIPSLTNGMQISVPGQLAILGAAISYAFAAVYGRGFKRRGVAPLVTAAGQVTASTLVLLPIVLFIDQPWQRLHQPMSIWLSVLGLSLICTAFAYTLYFRILSNAGATNLALVTLLVPVTAILLGGLFLNETLLAIHWLGMFIIALSLAIIDGRLLAKFGVG